MSDFNQHDTPPYTAYNTPSLPPQKPRRSWKRPAAFIGGGLLIFIVGIGAGSYGHDVSRFFTEACSSQVS